MKNFITFCYEVASDIVAFLPEEYANATAELVDVVKNNDQHLKGISIKKEGQNIVPNIYLEHFYEEYMNGKDMNDILKELAEIRVKNDVDSFDSSSLTEFEKVKDKITARLINKDRNKEILQARPHRFIDDLAVTYAIDLGQSSNGNMSAPITNEIMAKYGVDVEELDKLAAKNLDEQFLFQDMRDVMIEMMFGPNGPEENDPRMFMLPPKEEKPAMYVLSNKNKVNGAASILVTEKMDEIASELGGEFVIIPSSVHEVIILRKNDDMSAEDIRGMINEVNTTQVAAEEVLGDHPYIYKVGVGLQTMVA